jgi:hypothetical protein
MRRHFGISRSFIMPGGHPRSLRTNFTNVRVSGHQCISWQMIGYQAVRFNLIFWEADIPLGPELAAEWLPTDPLVC